MRLVELGTMALAAAWSTEALRPRQEPPSNGVIGKEIGPAVNGSKEFMDYYDYKFPRKEAQKYNLTGDTTGTADIFGLYDKNNTAHGVPIRDAQELLSSKNLTDAENKLKSNASYYSAEHTVKEVNGTYIIESVKLDWHNTLVKKVLEKFNLTIGEYSENVLGRFFNYTTGGQEVNTTEVAIELSNCGGNAWGDGSGKYHKRLQNGLEVIVEENQQPKRPEPTSLSDALVGLLYDCGAVVQKSSPDWHCVGNCPESNSPTSTALPEPTESTINPSATKSASEGTSRKSSLKKVGAVALGAGVVIYNIA
jgi:hypothetical protein